MNILEQMRAKSQKKEIGEEDKDVVKGTARRVIVVRSPDPNVFEEAIFLVKEDYMRSPGVTQTQLLDEARRAAAGYVGRVSAAKKKTEPRKTKRTRYSRAKPATPFEERIFPDFLSL